MQSIFCIEVAMASSRKRPRTSESMALALPSASSLVQSFSGFGKKVIKLFYPNSYDMFVYAYRFLYYGNLSGTWSV